MCKHNTSHTISHNMDHTTHHKHVTSPMPNPTIKIINDPKNSPVYYVITQTTDPKWSSKVRRIIQKDS